MERKAFLELNLPIEVFYVHDPGEQAARDCAPVPESVEIIDIAILGDCKDIIAGCLEHAGAELRSEGWVYDPYARVWTPPEKCRKGAGLRRGKQNGR